MKINTISALKAGAAPIALGLAVFATPAFAQDPAADCTANPDAAECADQGGAPIIVTGSILRRTDTETVSPVTTLSAERLEERGVNTISEGLQRIAANGSGTISEGWNNGNNFAAGANAVSLRGLTVQKTLTIFDGLRMAPYPLADDGHRNFVDLNTIPDAIIERVEVLKDGASSTYGADAVAGVVNVITKKQVKGIHLNASAGARDNGDGGEYRLDATVGYGDLDEQGFNIYVNGTYRKTDVIWARNLDYPFNTGDYSTLCDGAGHCRAIGTRWYQLGLNADGTRGGSSIGNAPLVGPSTATGVQTGTYQLLNPDCSAFGMTAQTLPDSARSATGYGFQYPRNLCQLDMRKAYATARPDSERYGISFRATARIGESAEAYIAANYMHANTYSQLTPAAFADATTAPQTNTFSPVVLPIYVCSTGVGGFVLNPATGNYYNTSTGCSAANGTLNPNNPFASSQQNAVISGRYDLPRTVETDNRALRAAAGISGTFGKDDQWNYSLDLTASEVKVDRISANYLIPQRIADVIATGAYNFKEPWKNSQAVRDYVAPYNKKTSTSQLWQASATIGRSLFELPGGPLQAAIGAQYRHESINDPSANPENLAHPFDRYYTINAVGAVGSRNVTSGFFEVNAPFIEQAELNVSGRYDKYSSGQKNFSPKVGLKFKPVQQLLLRGTWSKGFRIPSFNEAYGLPTTGYTNFTVNCTTYAAFCAAHGNNSYVTSSYSFGRTSIGNAGLDPEKSTSWTLGAVFEPMRGLSFSVDYFNIKVKDVIANISAADQTAALDAYFKSGNTTAVPGVTVIPSTSDGQFPNALPLPGFVQFSFQNADQERVEGIDFGMEFNRDFGEIGFRSSLEASYLIKYEVKRADGSVERYDGSLSPCDYTSCSGSPKWRGSWENTVTYGKFATTLTAYYTHGYDEWAVDYGETECKVFAGINIFAYKGTKIPVKCHVKPQWNFDLAMRYKVNDNFTLYGNVLNVFNIGARYDPFAAYSITQYNPAWGQPNALGRSFRVGAKVDF